MLYNYIKVSLRGFLKDRVIAGINIMSLAVGLAGVMAIYFYVQQELGIDAGHQQADRIYRVTFDETIRNADGRHLATTGPPMAPALEQDFPEVEKAVRLRYTDDVVLSFEDQQYYEKGLVYADDGFFDLFSFPLQKGDPQTVLASPNSIVLTPQMAQKYFGNTDPIGKSLLLDEETALNVTGVLAEQPSRTHLKFDGLISFSTFKVPFGYPVTLDSWGWISFHTYIMLDEANNASALTAKLPDFITKYQSAERAERFALRLQPIQDIYFHSGSLMNNDKCREGNIIYIYGLSIIALLLMVVAGFNYMNIATARSIRRGREIGVRKVLGAGKSTILKQMLAESTVVALLSLFLGLMLFEIFKQQLSIILNLEVVPSVKDYLYVLPLFIGIAVLVGLLAGLYPSLILSRFRTVDAMKGQLKTGMAGISLRKFLIVTQFVVTAGLIAGALMVHQQMDYVGQKSMGFDQEQIISLQMQTPDFLERYPRARQILLQNPNVSSVSAGDILDGDYGSVPIVPDAVLPENAPAMHILGGYFDYFSTLGVEVIAGRDFSMAHTSDTSGIILNESAVQFFGWEDPIGKRIQVGEIKTGEVIGVVKDFHFKSLHDPIQPLVAFIPETHMEYLVLRIKTEDVAATIASLQADWQQIAPDLPFDFAFLDDQINLRYQADESFSRLIGFFSIIAILLACLGLYGLIATIIEYRVREIGIRKVLGATIGQITTLLSREFLLLLLLANLIAIPLAIWGIQQWLHNFTYHIAIPWSVFLVSGGLTILLALVAISHQTLRAALANPVEALRDE
ncbi:MAG: ABC transporter permease [Saprospiraceae bacterium]|nr:MAG: ABC transporter permease [Saprospiraceae bacterium]